MQIKSIEIENFGNFHNWKQDFSDGVNSVIKENGWGKSTLAAFIKAMLYGLEERGSRRKERPGAFDRERYFPWNGGKFGGSMTFSDGTGEFCITRFFDGTKASGDTKEVIDLASNLPAAKFAGKTEPGLILFGIDRDSFERSCFVTLDREKAPALNDSINAKLNNLLDASDDVGNFEAADARLKKACEVYRMPRSEKTVIKRLETEIGDCTEKLSEMAELEESLEKTSALLDETVRRKTLEEAELKKIEGRKENIILFEKKKLFQNLTRRTDEAEDMQKKLLDAFKGTVPDELELSALTQKNNRLAALKSEMERLSVTPEKRESYCALKDFFQGDIPSYEEVENCQRNIDERKELLKTAAGLSLDEFQKEKFSRFQRMFSNVQISPSVIKTQLDRISELGRMNSEMVEKSTVKKQLEQGVLEESKRKKINFTVCLSVFSVIFTSCLGAGLLFLFQKKPPLIFVSCLAVSLAAMLGLVVVVLKPRKKSESEKALSAIAEEISALEKDIEVQKIALSSFISSIHPEARLENAQFELSKIESEYNDFAELGEKKKKYDSLVENNPRLSSVSSEIQSFTVRFEKQCGTSDEDKILSLVRTRLQAFSSLEGSISRYDSALHEFESTKQELLHTLEKFNTDRTQSFEEQLSFISGAAYDLKNLRLNISSLKKEIEDFSAANNIEEILAAREEKESLAEINREFEEANSRINSFENQRAQYQSAVVNMENELEKRPDLENRLSAAKEDLKKAEKRAEVLFSARSFLKEAYDSLSNRYMGKMTGAFEKYVSALSDGKEISIDRNLDVSIKGEGSRYGTEFFSEGYRDLVNFCTRLALVSAMFPEEKPVLILDDPFVNLDEKKIENARKLIEQTAENLQVLYFACHETRTV